VCLQPARYRQRHVEVVWLSATVAVAAGVIYFGVFSPGPIAMVLGIYFVSLGQNLFMAAAVYLICALTLAGVAGAVIAGALADPGLLHGSYLDVPQQLTVQALVQLILLCTFLLGRASRRATLQTMTDLELAVRAVAQREALLQEARHDLERALAVGGAGRFTGQHLGSFELGDVIGRGAMGEVYEARHRGGGEPAAVKLLHPHVLVSAGHLERFLREMRAAAEIRSPHVVRVLEIGELEAPLPYLAMELLRGHDLAAVLRARRRMSPAAVLDLIRQVGAGLSAAADAGIVHRDIKPQNLFRDERDGVATWKILDFGVSRLRGRDGTLTQGNVVGTPVYMAPEQAVSAAIDHRSDLYALGAIAYRALTGSPPYRGKDVPALLYSVVHEMPPRPTELAALPAEVDAVLAIALAKDPADRFATATALGDALADALAGRLDPDLRRRAGELSRRAPWR
jgi:eukaryotic-like serine/threonine-protein kinase